MVGGWCVVGWTRWHFSLIVGEITRSDTIGVWERLWQRLHALSVQCSTKEKKSWTSSKIKTATCSSQIEYSTCTHAAYTNSATVGCESSTCTPRDVQPTPTAPTLAESLTCTPPRATCSLHRRWLWETLTCTTVVSEPSTCTIPPCDLQLTPTLAVINFDPPPRMQPAAAQAWGYDAGRVHTLRQRWSWILKNYENFEFLWRHREGKQLRGKGIERKRRWEGRTFREEDIERRRC